MGAKRLSTRAGATLAATAAIGLVAATAIAGVTVYTNKFARKGDAREMRHAEGRHCEKGWRKKAESFRVDVQKGPEVCAYGPPVEGDTDRPDHDFQAKEKLLRVTPKAVRDRAFLAIAVRAGRTSGYELRVFPTRHRFRLVRSPSGGGGGFPAKGRSSAIKGFRKQNVLRLKAVNDKVTAKVNGTRVARVTDSNPAQVGGRKLEVAIGHRKRSRKPVVGNIDNLRLQVPEP